MSFLWQLAGFMAVGTLGVAVNAIVFQSCMKTSLGAKRLGQLPVLSRINIIRYKFSDITLAWGLGILAAFLSNFLLSKYFVFGA